MDRGKSDLVDHAGRQNFASGLIPTEIKAGPQWLVPHFENKQ